MKAAAAYAVRLTKSLNPQLSAEDRGLRTLMQYQSIRLSPAPDVIYVSSYNRSIYELIRKKRY